MTELGIVGRAPVVVLDSAGGVSLLGGPALLDWWVGAEDRWHLASEEPAVRQGPADDAMSVETRLKIPGGDAVQRVVVVPSNATAVSMVEIQNASPVPVAVAVLVHVPSGSVTVEGDTVFTDGSPVLRAGRSIARVVVAPDMNAARRAVEQGEAMPPAELEFPIQGSVVAAIFPVPHTATLRSVVALQPEAVLAAPDDLPPVSSVARGWASHLELGASMTVPDKRVMQATEAARRHLLTGSGLPMGAPFWAHDVSPWVPAVAAAALDAWGHLSEGRELLLGATGPDDPHAHATRGVSENGALLWAWAERLERQPDRELETAVGPWVRDAVAALIGRRGRLARRLARPGDAAWKAVGLAAAASLMSRMGDHVLASDVLDALPVLLERIDDAESHVALALGGNRLDRADPPLLVDFLAASDSESPLTSVVERNDVLGRLGQGERSQHPELSALWLLALRRSMVHEPDGTGGTLALMSTPDRTWLGGSVEALNMPVTGGTASFGVRWHGDRPALLWDVQTGSSMVGVTAPGLDARWADERSRGETLLDPTPGLIVGPGPESAEVRSGETLEIDDEPDSFQ